MASLDVAQQTKPPETAEAHFGEAVAIMARLRGPDGCAWDREQTPETIRKYTLEETYEVLDAIERKNPGDLCEELGDLLLQVLFYAQMSSERGEFSIADVVAGLNRKLVRRHPHVFGPDAAAAAGKRAQIEAAVTPVQVVSNWHAIKKMETRNEVEGEGSPSRLIGVLRSQPALLEAAKLGAAASRCGFDWPDAAGLVAKIREETDEVEAELASREERSRELGLEIGDLLFVTANLARHLHRDPEMALRDANAKFRSRFRAMEQAEGPPLESRSLDELEGLWQEAKRRERGAGSGPTA